MHLLLLSIAFLFIAPLLNMLSLKKDYFYCSLNGFVFVIIAALVSMDILPRLISSTGPEIILIMLIGFAVPTLIERVYHKHSQVHKFAVIVGVVGLTIHTLADGAALALESNHTLALGVAIPCCLG